MEVGEGHFGVHIVDAVVRFLVKFAFVHIEDIYWRVGLAFGIKIQLLLSSQYVYVIMNWEFE